MPILLSIGTELSVQSLKLSHFSEDVHLQGQMFSVNVSGCVQVGALHTLLLECVILCGVTYPQCS